VAFAAQMDQQATPPPEVRGGSEFNPAWSTITVKWRGAPILIHHAADEVRMARSTRFSELSDRFARNEALPRNAPADDANRKVGHENWLVVRGFTHMGCLLKSQEAAATSRR
jgi:hypothetical protein